MVQRLVIHMADFFPGEQHPLLLYSRVAFSVVVFVSGVVGSSVRIWLYTVKN